MPNHGDDLLPAAPGRRRRTHARPSAVARRRRHADGLAGPTRRFAFIVSGLVVMTSLPVFAAVSAGSSTIQNGSMPGHAVPFISEPAHGPVIVSAPKSTRSIDRRGDAAVALVSIWPDAGQSDQPAEPSRGPGNRRGGDPWWSGATGPGRDGADAGGHGPRLPLRDRESSAAQPDRWTDCVSSAQPWHRRDVPPCLLDPTKDGFWSPLPRSTPWISEPTFWIGPWRQGPTAGRTVAPASPGRATPTWLAADSMTPLNNRAGVERTPAGVAPLSFASQRLPATPSTTATNVVKAASKANRAPQAKAKPKFKAQSKVKRKLDLRLNLHRKPRGR